MNDIDFLPQDYVCVQTKRNKSNWLRGLFVIVLCLMGVGWSAQRAANRELAASRDRIQEQAMSMLAKLESPDGLKADLHRLDNEKHLVDALRLNVPPTRWLSAIVSALPAQTVVTEIRSEIEDVVEPTAKPDPGAAKSNEIKPSDPVEQDLVRLARLVPRRTLSISIRGTASDDLEVSSFLNALHRCELFERVQLLFTDQQARGKNNVRSFAIRLHTQTLNRRVSPNAEGEPARTVADRTANQKPGHSTGN